MKTQRKVATLAATLITFGSLAGGANGAITLNITDNGTDLIMTASGSFDLTNAPAKASTSGLGANALVAPPLDAYGWETGAGTSTHYDVTFSGSLAGTANAFPADFTTVTVPFWVDFDQALLVFQNGVVNGSVNESATFNGITLSDLGMIGGESVTASWGLASIDEQITINVGSAIPEPSSALLLGLGALSFAARRRRTT